MTNWNDNYNFSRTLLKLSFWDQQKQQEHHHHQQQKQKLQQQQYLSYAGPAFNPNLKLGFWDL